MNTPPTPWRVVETKLRPQFATRIIEVVDADGITVIPWTGFDSMDGSMAKKRRVARLIVQSVNTFDRLADSRSAVRTALMEEQK